MLGRCEYKFMIDRDVYEPLRADVASLMAPDIYSGGKPYTVSSLYFDDTLHKLYYQTFDREPFRRKLRLRVYGNVDGESSSFFEIKSKHLGRSLKRRLKLPLHENEELYITGRIPERLNGEDRRLAEDILRFIESEKLVPASVVSYERLAFAAEGEERLRVTFDSALRIRTDRLDLRYGSDGESAIPNDKLVVEMKSGANLPRELAALTWKYRLSNVSFSKYGYTRFVTDGETAFPEKIYERQTV